MDPFADADLPRPLRFLRWSFPVGRFFGVEVRLYATALLVLVVAFAQFDGLPGVGALEALALAGITWVLLYLVVWTHEMGHVTAAWRLYSVRTPTISLSMFGGVAHLSYPTPSPKGEILVSLAGPAVHGVWLLVLWLLRPVTPGLAGHGDWLFDPVGLALQSLWTLNVSLALFNLLPFFPLDGGHVLRALLALRWHPNRASRLAAQVGIVGAIGITAWGIAMPGWQSALVVGVAISMIVQCRREMLLAQFSEGPYGARHEAWEQDPDAWRHGESGFGDRVQDDARPASRRARGLIPRLGRRATPDDGEREPGPASGLARSPEEAAELDRLLARVSEVGISGLSDDERTSLRRLSETRRAPR